VGIAVRQLNIYRVKVLTKRLSFSTSLESLTSLKVCSNTQNADEQLVLSIFKQAFLSLVSARN